MGFQNREFEIKGWTKRGNMRAIVESVRSILSERYDEYTEIVNSGTDLYWQLPKNVGGDFLRLRKLKEKLSEITVKHQDRGTVRDRVEIDLPVSDHKQAETLLSYLLGPSAAKVTKRYHVFVLGNKHETVSVYQVVGYPGVFIESESRRGKLAQDRFDMLSAAIEGGLKTVNKSLYALIVKPQLTARAAKRRH